MTLKDWLTLLFGSGVLVSAWGYLYSRIVENSRKQEALRLGVQALLRDRLIAEYNKWLERGYAPIYARENFQNMWEQYHSLGKNGVMDGVHDIFMELPTEKKGEHDNE